MNAIYSLLEENYNHLVKFRCLYKCFFNFFLVIRPFKILATDSEKK